MAVAAAATKVTAAPLVAPKVVASVAAVVKPAVAVSTNNTASVKTAAIVAATTPGAVMGAEVTIRSTQTYWWVLVVIALGFGAWWAIWRKPKFVRRGR
jgi:hypothetical protein